jgi:CDGSH-type Zn-finger protein
MARLVKHDRQGPYKLDRDGETLWICGCGLSLDKPFCDATHLKTRDEEEGALYV